MRRLRRAMKRNAENPYGVIIMGPDEPFAAAAFAALGRWTFRHRSALAPFALALAGLIASGIIHQHHAGWWVPVTAVTAAAVLILGFPLRVLHRRKAGRRIAGVLARLWDRLGIGRAIERAYATAVIAGAGGWLAAAIASGPAARPLPGIEAALTVLLGIPWWTHRRRRAKVRVERTVEGWDGLADNIGLPGSRIASVVVDTWGWTARVILRKGTTSEQAIAQVPAIESALGTRKGSIRIIPDDGHAGTVFMRVTETDPHASVIPWPGATARSIAAPVDLGVSDDGRTVSALLLRRNVLIGGTTGAGKSGLLSVIIAALAACPDAVLWGVDLKGGMELQPWASCLDRLATTPEQACALFRDAVGWLNRRAREKAAQGSRVLDPSPDDPALVIIVDEYAELPDEAHDCADSAARRGRAVAVNLIAATQKPTQAAMGRDTAVRSQMDVRIALRVRERRDTDLIIGQGSLAAGWNAHALTRPGEFLVSSPEHPVPERSRAYLITDDQVARQAAAWTASRPALPDGGPDVPPDEPEPDHDGQAGPGGMPADDDSARPEPEAALWEALCAAGDDGATVADLMAACGMGRSWVYYRLSALADAGRAVQASRGTWRAVPGDAP